MEDLTELPNIGPVLARKLQRVSIASHADLVALGCVEAALRIGETDPSACYNMPYAIEGAIRGVRWHAMPREERALIRQRLDAARSA